MLGNVFIGAQTRPIPSRADNGSVGHRSWVNKYGWVTWVTGQTTCRSRLSEGFRVTTGLLTDVG